MQKVCPVCGCDLENQQDSMAYVSLQDGSVYLNIRCPSCGTSLAVNDEETKLEEDAQLIPMGMIFE